MSEKLRYRKIAAPVREREELKAIVEPMMVPLQVLEPIKPKMGRPKKVVIDFNDDLRSDNLGVYIGQGLSVTEAGILAHFSAEEIHDLQRGSESFRRFVELQMIKLKQRHLKVIQDKADPKTSQWMLEKTFPHEFAVPKTTTPDGQGSTAVLAAIFRTVQRRGDEPIPTSYVDINNQEEEQGHHESSDSRESETSLESGGENIIG
jgi:hypothetical protein